MVSHLVSLNYTQIILNMQYYVQQHKLWWRLLLWCYDIHGSHYSNQEELKIQVAGVVWVLLKICSIRHLYYLFLL